MKKVAWMVALVLVVLVAIPPSIHAGGAVVVGGQYWSGHRHWRGYSGFHFYWGGPLLLGPWWYPYYDYPYAPRQVVPAPSPPVFIQPEPQPQTYWYYCRESQGYYPYVQSCPGGWMKVVPEAPKQ